jgi:hypothetical protein
VAADSELQAHLGVENSLFTSTSTETTLPASSAGGTTVPERKIVSSSSEFGLPGSSALTFGVLAMDHLDFGLRLAYSSQSIKTGVDTAANTTSTSGFTIDPFAAYVFGPPENAVRFKAGLCAGIGSGGVKTETPSTSPTAPATSVDSSYTTTQWGALVGVNAHVSDLVSLDPNAMLLKTSLKLSSPDTSLSGLTFMFNVGISFWFGGHAPSPAPNAPTVTAGGAVPGEPTTGERVVAGGKPESEDTPSGDAQQAPKDNTHFTLPLGDNRVAILTLHTSGEEKTVGIMLRESSSDSNLATCKEIALHAPNKDEVNLATTPTRVSSQNGAIWYSKSSISLEQFSALIASPIAKWSLESDHWFVVCGRHWPLAESERLRLIDYLQKALH